jgi:hypothetical protein
VAEGGGQNLENLIQEEREEASLALTNQSITTLMLKENKRKWKKI